MKIFFDLDGTLVDASARNYAVYKEVVRQFRGDPLEKEVYWDYKRQKAKWPELLPLSGLDANLKEPFLDVFIEKVERPDFLNLDALFPSSRRILGQLSAEHFCVLVSLRRNRANLLEELNRLQINSYFRKVLSGHSETDGYDKKIELIKEELGADKGLIIGDTEADIVSAKELGMVSVAVETGIRDKRLLMKLNPDYMLQDISGLPSLVKSLSH